MTEARRERLRGLLREETYLPLARVCELLGVSEATARRDLASLVEMRQARRTHGGALSPYAGALGDFERFFPTFEQRRGQHAAAKRAIARAAAGLIRGGMTVFLDAGTTCFAIAEAVEAEPPGGDEVTVLTHNLAAAIKLAGVVGVRVEVLGGRLLPRQAALFGDEACRAVSARRVDLALVGGEGFAAEGVYNSQEDVVRLQRAAMAAAARTVMVLDAAKLGVVGPVQLSGWGACGLVTDATRQQVVRAGIRVERERLVAVKVSEGSTARYR